MLPHFEFKDEWSKILFTPYNFCNYAICKDRIVSGGVWISPCQMPIGSSITLPALSKFYTVIYFEILHNSFPDWSDVSWKFFLHWMKRKLFLKTEILQQIGTHTTNLYTRLKICIKIYDLFKRDMENIFFSASNVL